MLSVRLLSDASLLMLFQDLERDSASNYELPKTALEVYLKLYQNEQM